MKVIPEGGPDIDLGTLETSPTIGMIDYSRRVTDDFGTTTVVKRGFARRMSVRFALPFEDVDAVQASLAELRATAARWEADVDYDWLNFDGFFKDFDIDLAVPPLSFCTLTVEGLTETEAGADDGSDPATDGVASTLFVIDPVTIGDAQFVSSNVTEDDYSAWSAGVTYVLGARVIKTATHRIYESAADENVGNDPATSPLWIDIGPTNRWAMFDQALGTATARASSIVVVIAPGTVNSLALLDVVATDVRVQCTGYDETLSASSGAVSFLDLPGAGGNITVTISGSGTVSVGTLLAGTIRTLGVTGESPSAGITDFSRKEVDEFGDATIVERAWAKRMNTQALIQTSKLDIVANRIASLRATPALWIGDDGTQSLQIYGFFKDFSIEVGETVSNLSLSIEGLSKASPIGSSIPVIDWSDLTGTEGVTTAIEAAQAAADAAIGAASKKGRVFFQNELPSGADSAVNDTCIRLDGTFFNRVPGGIILKSGGVDKVVTLGGFRPSIYWTKAAVQPLAGAVETSTIAKSIAEQAIGVLADLANDGILSKDEKIKILIPRSDNLESAWQALSAAAVVAGVSTATCAASRAAWLEYRNALIPAWDDINSNTAVERLAYDAALNGYAAALEALNTAVIEAMTAAKQVSISRPPDQIIYRNYNLTVKQGQLPRVIRGSVKRGGVEIIASNDVTHAVTGNSGLSGKVSVNNDVGSASKGNITIADSVTNGGDIQWTVTVGGVAQPSQVIKVTTQDDIPPTGGTSGGGSAGSTASTSDFAAVNSTGYTVIAGPLAVSVSDGTADFSYTGAYTVETGSPGAAYGMTTAIQWHNGSTWELVSGSEVTEDSPCTIDGEAYRPEHGFIGHAGSAASLSSGEHQFRLVGKQSGADLGQDIYFANGRLVVEA